jgi:hypothetical protein
MLAFTYLLCRKCVFCSSHYSAFYRDFFSICYSICRFCQKKHLICLIAHTFVVLWLSFWCEVHYNSLYAVDGESSSYTWNHQSKDVYTLEFYGLLLVLNEFRFIISFTLQISWLAKLRRSTGFSRMASLSSCCSVLARETLSSILVSKLSLCRLSR